jgi:gamma-glutamyltranspeptidase/glutathione hydrolase
LALACSITHARTTAPSQSELDTQWLSKPGWASRANGIAAANLYAARAGQSILKAGGSAVDVVVAAQTLLTLDEPQSSEIGGGAFLMHFDGYKTHAFDSRETAPAKVSSSLYLKGDDTPMGLFEATVGGLAVGVPSVIPMLFKVRQELGRLPWKRLLNPAIELAKGVSIVSPRMAALLVSDSYLIQDPVALAYFYDPMGLPWLRVQRLRNPELASVLNIIALRGPTGFMEGEVAEAIVFKVKLKMVGVHA